MSLGANGFAMHNATTANETLEILWNNYLALCEQVDLDAMPPEKFDEHVKRNSPVRPLEIAAWLARQGYFIAAWALWEYFSRSLCETLENQVQKGGNKSSVDWVNDSLAANDRQFPDYKWFSSANCLRNLIAHHGARAAGSRAESLFDRSRTAFPDIETYNDDYVALTHCHVADLQINIERFIEDTA